MGGEKSGGKKEVEGSSTSAPEATSSAKIEAWPSLRASPQRAGWSAPPSAVKTSPRARPWSRPPSAARPLRASRPPERLSTPPDRHPLRSELWSTPPSEQFLIGPEPLETEPSLVEARAHPWSTAPSQPSAWSTPPNRSPIEEEARSWSPPPAEQKSEREEAEWVDALFLDVEEGTEGTESASGVTHEIAAAEKHNAPLTKNKQRADASIDILQQNEHSAGRESRPPPLVEDHEGQNESRRDHNLRSRESKSLPPPTMPLWEELPEEEGTLLLTDAEFSGRALGDALYHAEGARLEVAIAGGRGGVGRSFLAANIACNIARSTQLEVLVVDLDPAGPNLHTYLGVEPLLKLPGELLRGEKATPQIEGVPRVPKLKLCRSSHPLEHAPSDRFRFELFRAARASDATVIIYDLGCLPSALTLDIFVSADLSLSLALPEPSSIERLYHFLHMALYRNLTGGGGPGAVLAKTQLRADQIGQLSNPLELIEGLRGVHSEAAISLRARLERFRPYLLMNRCHTREDRELIDDICTAISRRWRINAISLGGLDHEEVVQKSLMRREPLMLSYPGSSVGIAIERLARRFVSELKERI
ncbi:MAG: P-loop NTPase [Myxococcota bacterium]|nr:P-loop NTPase [Myxococcota bacterium]